MRRGFANVVPIHALALFTASEAEVLVAGKRDVAVAVLKAHTRYSGWSATDPTITFFWKVLEGFTPEQRSDYLRFVWGRSRLPTDATGWTSEHTIARSGGGDGSLPNAHTCFNTIDLPAYTTEAITRARLLTTITYGLSGVLNG